MVRVATLHDQVESGTSARDAAGCTAERDPDGDPQPLLGQRGRAGALRAGAAAGPGRARDPSHLDRAGRRPRSTLSSTPLFESGVPGSDAARHRPRQAVSLHLQPLALARRGPSRSRQGQRDPRPRQGAEGAPRPLPAVGEGGNSLFRLDALIAANLGSLFPGMEVVEHALFRVTRDTDYDVSDETDDVLRAVEEELRRRRFGEVVRLEVEVGMNEGLQDQLVAALGISRTSSTSSRAARSLRPQRRRRPVRARRAA